MASMQDRLRDFVATTAMGWVYRLGGVLPRLPCFPSLDAFHEWKRGHPRVCEAQEWLADHDTLQLAAAVVSLVVWVAFVGAVAWAGGVVGGAVVGAVAGALAAYVTIQPLLCLMGFVMGDDP